MCPLAQYYIPDLLIIVQEGTFATLSEVAVCTRQVIRHIPGIPAPELPMPAQALADSHKTADFAIPWCADWMQGTAVKHV